MVAIDELDSLFQSPEGPHLSYSSKVICAVEELKSLRSARRVLVREKQQPSSV